MGRNRDGTWTWHGAEDGVDGILQTRRRRPYPRTRMQAPPRRFYAGMYERDDEGLAVAGLVLVVASAIKID